MHRIYSESIGRIAMETWDAVCSRRGVRVFLDRPIAQDMLLWILEGARRSPSARNKQRWDFVIVTERPLLQQLSAVWQGAGHVAGAAAAVALVVPKAVDAQERESIRYDLGQATMGLMILAADRGIGTRHARVQDQALAAELLGLPPGYECAFLISLGYPADRPLSPVQSPDRRSLADVVHWGQF
jgi:nitroreductase